MKKSVLFAVLVGLLLSASGCDSILNPTKVVKLEIVEGPTFQNGSMMFGLTGRVKNTGEKTAMYARIVFNLYDSSGNFLIQDWNYLEDSKLEEGEISTFEVLFADEDGTIRAKLDMSKTAASFYWD